MYKIQKSPSQQGESEATDELFMRHNKNLKDSLSTLVTPHKYDDQEHRGMFGNGRKSDTNTADFDHDKFKCMVKRNC